MRKRRHALRKKIQKKARDLSLTAGLCMIFVLVVLMAHFWAFIALTGIPAAFLAGWFTARWQAHRAARPARAPRMMVTGRQAPRLPAARTGPLKRIPDRRASREKILSDPRSGASPLTGRE
jgi:hypothetical protein